MEKIVLSNKLNQELVPINNLKDSKIKEKNIIRLKKIFSKTKKKK